MKRILRLIVLLIVLGHENSSAQMNREWVQRYNGTGNSFDVASGLFCSLDGGVIVYGSQIGVDTGLDFCVIKYDKSGNKIWKAIYSGSGNQTDQLNSAVQDDSGNIYVTGFTTLEDGNISFAVGKVSSSGEFIWVRTIEEEGFDFGIGNSICVVSPENIAAAGFLRDSANEINMLLAVINPSGTIFRKEIVTDPPGSAAIKIAPLGKENFVVAFDGMFGANSTDIAVAKYDILLNRIWINSFNGSANASSDKVADLTTDKSGKIFICGSIINDSTSSDYITACMNSSGTVLWRNEYRGEYLDIPSSVYAGSNGYTYVTGVSATGSTLTTENIYTIKIESDGSSLWSRSYDGAGNGIDRGSSVAEDDKGNVFVGGYSDRGNVQVTYAFLRYSSDGNLTYFDRYSIANTPEDFGYALAIDSGGSVYFTGISAGIGTDYDIATLKYSRSVGVNTQSDVVRAFQLGQNYPNPFNPKTIINYELRIKNFVTLKVYDIKGREVATLVNDIMPAGRHAVEFNAEEFSSGVYFYSVYLDGIYSDSKKMILLK